MQEVDSFDITDETGDGFVGQLFSDKKLAALIIVTEGQQEMLEVHFDKQKLGIVIKSLQKMRAEMADRD